MYNPNQTLSLISSKVGNGDGCIFTVQNSHFTLIVTVYIMVLIHFHTRISVRITHNMTRKCAYKAGYMRQSHKMSSYQVNDLAK